ncbi:MULTISPECIES: ABC transporter substrate-binding protein [unclassified Pseudomonas]|uniref:ABC transporter substrate-binding protein n=1 Tax=unclassified Pseudomonas TaxID=196821 RepID=UPI0008774DCE|nr:MULTISPECIES: ABC transporter substrate-binding protein [unclassified Pseudomonas]SDA71956.1 osmoprotectant transport system substrate-binding protein [Pseudomonas sp. NFACC51]SDX05433.1 osmoprotectant transport system substrate-binding protein [Pseudomonas sp. NFACC08-1]SCZ26260.1 osmoprotectant transport system substrate-binding protein [Pseudomonas sp. NFACC44-2]SEI76733.1 osmoprotectant transport system substrate-binding protein [Pseudomonas sp. NFACC07-1]SFH32645.1 osmoprotectant trans
MKNKQRSKTRSAHSVSLLLGLGLLAGSAFASAQSITIGGANFSEQTILANIYASALKNQGIDVKTRLNLGNRQIIAKALENGDIDVVPEYIGSLLSFYDDKTALTSQKEIVSALQQKLPAGLQLLEPSAAGSITAWAVTRKTAEKYNLHSLSDLAPVSGDLTLGGPPEVTTAALGLPGLKAVYGINFKSVKSLDMGGPLSRLALNSGAIDVATVVSTQGILAKEPWVVLEDDKHQQPLQNITPLGRKALLTPEVTKVLNEVSAKLTDDDLKQLNRLVDIDHKDPAKVAAQWVAENTVKAAN